VSGSSVSSLTVNFDWSNSTDVDGDNVNYTFQIANNSGYSPLENETNVTDSNFTYTVPSAGTWYWRVRAYDAEDASSFATAFVIVSLGGGGGNVTDTTPPLVVLNSPANNAWLQDGSVTFVYTPSEQLSSIASCSLYINGALNQTNTTAVVNNAENNFIAAFTDEASYNWTVGCTDTSTAGPNSGNATQRVVRVDNATPTITAFSITYPGVQSEVKDGQSIVVDIGTSDSGSGVASVTVNCSSLNGGFVAATLQSGNGASGTWRASCAVSGLSGVEGDVNISATASDAVSYSTTNVTAVVVDNVAPVNPAYLNVTGYPADNDGIINLTWPASVSAASYNVYRSNVGGFTPSVGLRIGTTGSTVWTDTVPSDGTWYWKVTAVDNAGNENLTGAPQNYTLVDTGAPAVILDSPSDGVYVQSGNVTFVYTPSGETNTLASCTLYLNGVATTTKTTPDNDAQNIFIADIQTQASYAWTVGCVDTSSNARNATSRTLNVDNATPTVDAIAIGYPSVQTKLKDGQSISVNVTASDAGRSEEHTSELQSLS
jgi:hypothetical protein